jgi:hypothetical protein
MMAKPTPPAVGIEASQFSVDLSEIELTDEELTALQNQITRLVFDSVRNKVTAAGRKKEPYVKIIYVRSTHVRSPTK